MMKQIKLTFLLAMLFCMVGVKTFAYDIAVKNADGVTIYYNYISDGKELEVTYKNHREYSYPESVVIPNEVTFMNRTRKVTCIGDSAFYDYTNSKRLISVTIPNSIATIGYYAFAYCSGLTSITIPNSVTSIGEYAFCGCERLTSVDIGNSVTAIGMMAFEYCDKLTSITIPNSVKTIGCGAFYGCRALSAVYIYDIAAWCNIKFSDCGSTGNPLAYAHHLYLNGEEVEELVIPNNVTSIDYDAFHGCDGLITVTIPNGVTSIGDYAFRYCRGLTSVNIPNSVTSIGNCAFQWCQRLSSVTIGNSVTSIGEYAFSGADIPTVISLIENPIEINTNTFSNNTFNNAALYVPVGSIDKYKSTKGWKNFVFIEEGAFSNVVDIRDEGLIIHYNDRTITISGIEKGTPISLYENDGTLIDSMIASGENITFGTSIPKGEFCIVKIRDKAIKILAR